MFLRSRVIDGCMLAGCALPALAQNPANPVSPGSLLQMFAGLAVVLGLVIGAAWILRRIGRVPGFANQAIRTIAAASLGSRERVVLLEVADTWVLVGVAPGQVRSLATLPKGELPKTAASPTQAPPFAHWLQRFTDRHDAP